MTTDPALTATVTGAPANGVAPVYSLSRVAGQDVNDYTITVTAATTSNANYTVTTETGTFSITPVAITIKADDKTKTYDNDVTTDPALTATVTGVPANGVAPVYSLGRVVGQNVGNYTITVTAGENPNYTVTVTNGNFEITIAAMTVTVTGHTGSAVYDGASHSVTGYDLSCNNPLYDESRVSFNGTAVASGTTVGTYPMGLSAGQFSYDNSNVNVAFEVTDGSLEITGATVTVTITEHADTVMYDGQSHTVTGFDITSISNPLYTMADFTSNFTSADTIMTGDTVGTYISSLASSMFSNVNLNFTGVVFDIVRKGLVIKKNDTAIVIASGSRDFNYDGSAHSYPSYTVTYNGVAVPRLAGDSTKFELPTGDVLSVINPASITYFAENNPQNNTFDYTIENAGSYDASAVTFNYGTIGISAMSQAIRIASLGTTWNYDGEAYTYKHYMVQFGDSVLTMVENDTVFTLPTGDHLTITNAPSIRYVGKIANTFTYTLDNDIQYIGERTIIYDTLRVNPKPDVITITANSAEKVYDGIPLTDEGYSYSPANVLVNGDSLVVEVEGSITAAGDSANRVVAYRVYRNENINQRPHARGLMMMAAPAGYTRDVTDCYTFATAHVDGLLRVTKNGNVTVTITGHTGEFDADGTVHSVHGYDVVISDTLGIYLASDISFTGDDELDESAVGTYNMNLSSAQFANINNNYDPVNFVVNDGWMKIYDELTASVISSVDVTCTGENDGAATVLVTGGKPGSPRYSYVVTGNNTHDGYTGNMEDSLRLTSLRPDTYLVTVTDGTGMSVTTSFEIAIEPAISADNSTFTSPLNIDSVIGNGGCHLVLVEIGTPVFTTTTGIPMSEITISNNAPTDNAYPVGETVVTWTATDHCGNTLSCEQTVTVSFQTCPDAVDFEGNHYPSVRLGGGCKCWTTENLKSTLYSDGRPIDNVMSYQSDEYPDIMENVNIFGHLYDWYAAADTSSVSLEEIEQRYAHGQRVQGVCPSGWYLPSDEDFEELNVYSASELRSTEHWINSRSNTNATGFNSLPGGMYSCANDRFENLTGNAYYWTCHPVMDMATGAMIDYVCEMIMIVPPVMRCNGFSVRCVLVGE